MRKISLTIASLLLSFGSAFAANSTPNPNGVIPLSVKGAVTPNDCAKFVNGSVIADAGSTCGGGGGIITSVGSMFNVAAGLLTSVGIPTGYYNVKDAAYGAKGNGKTLTDVTTTASNATISSASYTFVSGDIAKLISCHNAATSSTPLNTTIASVSGGNAVLTVAPGVSIAGTGSCTFGTDDTTAITNAYNATIAAGLPNHLFFPSGTYMWNSLVLNLPLTGIHISGAGIGSTILKYWNQSNAVHAMFEGLSGDASHLYTNVSFEDMEIDQEDEIAANSSTVDKFVYSEFDSKWNINHIYAHGSPATEVGIDYLFQVDISHNWFKNCGRLSPNSGSGGGACIGLGTSNGDYTDVGDNYMDMATGSNGTYAILIESQGANTPHNYYNIHDNWIKMHTTGQGGIISAATDNTLIHDNQIDCGGFNTTRGIILGKGTFASTDSSQYVQVSNNFAVNCEKGYYFDGSAANQISLVSNKWIGNRARNSTLYGFYFHGHATVPIDGIFMDSNISEGSGAAGVFFDGAAGFTNVKINNMTCRGNATTTATAALQGCYSIASPIKGLIMNGGHLYDNGAGTQLYGLIVNGVSVTNSHINLVDMTGNVTGALSLVSGGTISGTNYGNPGWDQSGSLVDMSLGIGTSYSSLILPQDTTSNRPTGIAGMVRYNTTIPQVEAYVGSSWSALGVGTSSANLSVGTSSISGGTNHYVEYNNNGALGEYPITGTAGSVMMSASPTATGTLTAAALTATGAVSLGTTTLSNTVGSTQCLHVNSSGVISGTGSDCGSGGGSGITIASTTVTGGSTTNILYDNGGVVGEYTISGTGTVIPTTASPTFTGTVTLGTSTQSGQFTNSAVGAASYPSVSITGTAYTGGSTTTNVPQVYINAGSGPTTFSANGTKFGINAESGWNGNFIDVHLNGGTSLFSVGATGAVTAANNFATGGSGAYTWTGRGILSSPAAGKIQLGATDSASPVAQTLQAQSVVTATSNTAGNNFTINGSNGTGTGGGGSIIFQTGAVGSTGSTPDTLTTALTLNNSQQGIFAGAVMIGTTSLVASTELTVNGTINQSTEKSCSTGLTTDANGSINGCVASDEKLKIDVASLVYDTTLIDSLRPVTYRWKDSAKFDNKLHGGFIAQEVAQVDPYAVKPAGENLLGIDNSALSADIVLDLQQVHKELDVQKGAFPWHKCVFNLLVCPN